MAVQVTTQTPPATPAAPVPLVPSVAPVERVWPGAARYVPEVRVWARQVLAGRVPAATGEAVELVVTELAANAIVHTSSGVGVFRVRVEVTSTGVCVAVSDQGGDPAVVPAPRAAADDAIGGRGLALVEALATRLVVEGDAGGRTVTAVLCAEGRAA